METRIGRSTSENELSEEMVCLQFDSLLKTFPKEIVYLLFEQFLETFGPLRALQLRVVCKSFNIRILNAFRHSHQSHASGSGPVNGLILSLVSKQQCMGMHLMGDLIHAQLMKKLPNHILSPINQAIEYITLHSSQTKEQLSEMPFQICKTVANRLYWSNNGSLGFLEISFGPDLIARHSTKEGINQSGLDSPSPGVQNTERIHNAMCAAVVVGDIDLFKRLLSSNPDVNINMNNKYFGRLLQLAALWDRIEFINFLLDMGADPCIIHDEFLIAENFDMEYPESFMKCLPLQGSALQVASGAGSIRVVQRLLKEGVMESHEYCRATLAAIRGRYEAIALLILKEAPNELFKHMFYDYSFHQFMFPQACYYGCEELVKLMVKGAFLGYHTLPLTTNSQWLTCLELAAIHGHHRIIHLILDSFNKIPRSLTGMFFEEQGGLRNWTPSEIPMSTLQIASVHGHEEVVQTLLDNGIKVDSREVYFAFVQASRMGQVRIMKLFLKNGLDIDMYQPYSSSESLARTWALTLGERAFIAALTHHMKSSIDFLASEGVSIYIPVLLLTEWDLVYRPAIYQRAQIMNDSFHGENSSPETSNMFKSISEKFGAEKMVVNKRMTEVFIWETSSACDAIWPLSRQQDCTSFEFKQGWS